MRSINRKIFTSTALVLSLCMTTMTGTPALSQTADTSSSLDPTLFNEDTITLSSLISDVVGISAKEIRQHTVPGGVVALENLQRAIIRSDKSDSAKSQALLRIAEIHLRLIGDSNSASLISAAARTVEKNDTKSSVAYMRGIAQDLRQAGSVAAAQYLETQATMVSDGFYSARTGLMDAAAISLTYGVTPQPGLSQMLAAPIEDVTPDYLKDLTSDLMAHISTVTDDVTFSELAQTASNLSQDDVDTIRERITTAKQERARNHSFRANPEQTQETQGGTNIFQ